MSPVGRAVGISAALREAEVAVDELISAVRYRRNHIGSPAITRKLHVTLFESPYADLKRDVSLSISDLARLVENTFATSKRRLPLLKLGSFGEEPNASGCLRTNRNLLSVDGVEVDYDGEVLTPQQAVDILKANDIAGCVYETPSSTPDAPRFRILCPASKTLAPWQRVGLVARLNGVFGGVLATESFTPSLSFFYGGIDGRPVPFVTVVDGRFIDQADDLDPVAIGADKQPFVQGTHGASEKDGEVEVIEDDLDLSRIENALRAIPEARWTDRDLWLRLMMSVKRATQGSEEGYNLYERYSALGGEKHDPDDQRRVWDSIDVAQRDGIGPGTLFYEAAKHGHVANRSCCGMEVLSVDDCLNAPLRDYVIKGFISRGDLCSVFGAPGAGKSTLCPHLAYHVAIGKSVFGLRVKRGLVFYIAAEDGQGMTARIAALVRRYGSTDNLKIIRRVSSLLDEDGSALDELMHMVRCDRPALIVIDTMAVAFPGLAENDSQEMAKVIAVGRMLTEHGAAVVMVHHDTKQKSDTPRGHGSFNGVLDSAMHLKSSEGGTVTGTLTKNRNGPREIDFSFVVRSEFLSLDADGDEVTAPVIDELAAKPAGGRRALAPSQFQALRVLEELLAEKPRGVSREVWRDHCIQSGLVSAANGRDGQRRAVNGAIKDLLTAGHVQIQHSRYITPERDLAGVFENEQD